MQFQALGHWGLKTNKATKSVGRGQEAGKSETIKTRTPRLGGAVS